MSFKEEEEEEEEPLLIYTAQGSPFGCKKLSVINGRPERNNVLKLCIHMHYTNTNNKDNFRSLLEVPVTLSTQTSYNLHNAHERRWTIQERRRIVNMPRELIANLVPRKDRGLWGRDWLIA